MNARIYARVSPQEQTGKGYSIAQQLRQCRQFARSQRWVVAGEYIDEGYSADDMTRPGLKELLEAASQGDVVVVWKLDRIVSSIADLANMLNRLEQAGLSLRSVTEPYDTTTPEARKLFIELVGALAKWHEGTEDAGRRIFEGITEAVREGKWHGGPVPFGYVYDKGKGVLVPDPKKAPIVKEIFRRYLMGEGTRSIAAWLNDLGLRTRKGAYWAGPSVAYILRNPIYTGRIAYGKKKLVGKTPVSTPERVVLSKRVYEPIVDDDTFEQVQRLLKLRGNQRAPAHQQHVYPLSGLLRCGKCGHPMNGHSKGRKQAPHRYYLCLGRSEYRICDAPVVRQDEIEAKVLSQLTIFSTQPLEQVIAKDHAQELQSLQAEARSLAERKKKWYDAYEHGAMPLDDLRDRLSALIRREAEVQERIAELTGHLQSNGADPEAWKASMLDLQARWWDMTPMERKTLLHELLQEIILNADGSVQIYPRL